MGKLITKFYLIIIRLFSDGPILSPKFSVKGLYAYLRHPMYFLFILALWICPQMTFTRLEFVILATLYFVIGTYHEERNLKSKLGEIYIEYIKNVPMWFPRLTPWKMTKYEKNKIKNYRYEFSSVYFFYYYKCL